MSLIVKCHGPNKEKRNRENGERGQGHHPGIGRLDLVEQRLDIAGGPEAKPEAGKRASQDHREDIHSYSPRHAPRRHLASAYSARNIVAGSMRTARITGGNAATSAATRMVSDGSASISASVDLT